MKKKPAKISAVKTYFYVTSVENFEAIYKKGLKPDNEGRLLLFDNQELAYRLATKQLEILDYALYRILELDESRLVKNEEDEFTALSQYYYDKEIPSDHLKLIGCFKNR